MSLAEVLPRSRTDGDTEAPRDPPYREPVSISLPIRLPVAAPSGRPLLSAAALGAVCGGVAALAAMWAWTSLVPAQDPRFDGFAERLDVIGGDVMQLAAAMGPVQAELAHFYDVAADMSGRIIAGQAETSLMIADIQAALAEQAELLAIGSPVFAVAALQLHSAAMSGDPFETELLNAYALAGDDPRLSPAMAALVGPARSGLVSMEALRAGLAATAVAAGIGYGASASYYEYSMSLISSYVGLSTEAYAVESGRRVLDEADAMLARGDLAGAREHLRQLDRSIAPRFVTWFDAAETRLAADAALGEIAATVHENLSGRLLAAGPGG